MMKFESILDRVQERELNQLQAAEILGMSERAFRRWRDRHEAEGLEGLFDRRLGKASAKRVPVDEIAWVLEQYRTVYKGWTVKLWLANLTGKAQTVSLEGLPGGAARLRVLDETSFEVCAGDPDGFAADEADPPAGPLTLAPYAVVQLCMTE